MNLNELFISQRTINAFADSGITTLDELLKLPYYELRSLPNIGMKAIHEVLWNGLHLKHGDLLKELEAFDPKMREKAKRYDAIAAICNKVG